MTHDEIKRALQAPDRARDVYPVRAQTRYFVCQHCAHTWSEPEHPAECEHCRAGAVQLSEFGDIDAAEAYSQEILDDAR